MLFRAANGAMLRMAATAPVLTFSLQVSTGASTGVGIRASPLPAAIPNADSSLLPSDPFDPEFLLPAKPSRMEMLMGMPLVKQGVQAMPKPLEAMGDHETFSIK